MKALVYLILAIATCASAAQHPAPVNVLKKDANWQSDLKVCQGYVADNFVPSSVAESRSTTAVCDVVEDTVTCRDVRTSSNPTDGASQTRKALVADEQDRQAMLASCLSDKGWRQRLASDRG